MFRSAVVAVICLAVVVPAMAQDRVTATEKGSLLIYPKVELRWDSSQNLIQDTFITINNDYNAGVDIQLYFVSETCTNVDNTITLTKNEPAYWSAYSGAPKGVSPFTVLGDPYPDPEEPSEYILRGYVIAWAIGEAYEQVSWNHLYGGATIVDYDNGEAWEYNAFTFQVLDSTLLPGEPVGTPGILNLDGVEYDSGFDILLLDFFASGSDAFSGGGGNVYHDTDLTLMILDNDVTQDAPTPPTTKAKFSIWNQNEVGFSGMEYCFTKWYQTLLSTQGGHFLVENLQTDKGRARIDGMASIVCDYEDPEGNLIESVDASLLGVAAKFLDFGSREARAGTNLFGAGVQNAVIKYDVLPAPPTLKNGTGIGAARPGPKVVR